MTFGTIPGDIGLGHVDSSKLGPPQHSCKQLFAKFTQHYPNTVQFHIFAPYEN